MKEKNLVVCLLTVYLKYEKNHTKNLNSSFAPLI